jgi:hypothetical protein
MIGVGGGCVGGSEVGGTDVGGMDVGGAEVLVACTRVGATRVDVGWGVDVEAMTPVALGPGSRVRGVEVGSMVGVSEGVIVDEGVAVGIVGVMVGRSDAVAVGTVDVGNGPSRASDVNARAVLVLFALPNRLAFPAVPRKFARIHRSAASKRASVPAARMFDRLLVRSKVLDVLSGQS